MQVPVARAIFLFVTAIGILAQQPSSSFTITDKELLPTASLWEEYSHKLQAPGGIEPYQWVLLRGSLPRGLQLHDLGVITGIPDQFGPFEFTVLVRDNESPPQQKQVKFTLAVETPLSAEWDRPAKVNGQRIDGSIKVSNRTGRDFDLTMIVLAVNEIGRATAIGYQHFSLKKKVRDLNIPFGDTVSRGSYAVNVDVVGEEPVSNQIYRARLVSGKQQVSQGP